ncbi:extracellular solute-binding protein [Nakamurella silvestris]|nr:extracellular solute-binding protein [Nakamurella silvestris]
MRRTPLVAGLAAVGLVIAACAGDASTSSPAPPPSGASTSTVSEATSSVAVSRSDTADSESTLSTDTDLSASTTGSPSETAATTSSPAVPGGAGGKVGVYTWWAAGLEKDGLDALLALFRAEYPNDRFVSLAVNGGDTQPQLEIDLKHDNPPDSFQWHAGAELSDYIKNGQIQPVDDVIAELGGSAVFPQGLLDRLTVDGHIYSVPANIHRVNMVWANPKVITSAGLDPAVIPGDMEAWIADLAKIKASGVDTPLTVGGTWTQVQLLENVLLADLGADKYTGLFDGSTDWAGTDVTAAVADFATLLTFTDTDAADGDDWPASIDAVADGTAAYNVMGDWAVAEFNSKKKVDGTDYTYFPTPGTDGVFDFLADSFTLPVRAKNQAGAKDWLTLIGSAEGQKAFNLAKGSIPARSDTAASDYPAYQQTAIASWQNDVIVPSIAHGSAVNLAWGSDIGAAVSEFHASGDATALQSELAAAAKKNAD